MTRVSEKSGLKMMDLEATLLQVDIKFISKNTAQKVKKCADVTACHKHFTHISHLFPGCFSTSSHVNFVVTMANALTFSYCVTFFFLYLHTHQLVSEQNIPCPSGEFYLSKFSLNNSSSRKPQSFLSIPLSMFPQGLMIALNKFFFL